MPHEIQPKETASDPWTDLDRAFTELWDLRAFGLPFVAFEPNGPVLRAARTDVSETGTAYTIVADVPGIPKDQIDIRVRGTSVEIRGESAKTEEKTEPNYVHRERTYAGYYRHLELPEPVVAAEAKAKVENGVLELELPKEHPTPSPTEVKVAVA